MTDPTIDKAALEALLPCPFCGGNHVTLRTNTLAGMSWVDCFDCGLQSPSETGVSADDAVTYWNRRALPSTTDAVGVTVRELEWRESPGLTNWAADSALGTYQIIHTGGKYWLRLNGDALAPGMPFITLTSSKAAAQADYTARIMLNISEVEPVAGVLVRAHKHTCANVQPGSTYDDKCDCGALDTAGNAIPIIASPTTSPQAPEGVRDDVLEEAAKVADKVAAEDGAHWKSAGRDEEAKSHYLWSMQTGEQIAAAIRALKGNRT